MRVTIVLCVVFLAFSNAAPQRGLLNLLIPNFDKDSFSREPVSSSFKSGAPQVARDLPGETSDTADNADEDNEDFDNEYEDNSGFWDEYYKGISGKVNNSSETDSDVKVGADADNAGAYFDNETGEENAEVIDEENSGSEIVDDTLDEEEETEIAQDPDEELVNSSSELTRENDEKIESESSEIGTTDEKENDDEDAENPQVPEEELSDLERELIGEGNSDKTNEMLDKDEGNALDFNQESDDSEPELTAEEDSETRDQEDSGSEMVGEEQDAGNDLEAIEESKQEDVFELPEDPDFTGQDGSESGEMKQTESERNLIEEPDVSGLAIDDDSENPDEENSGNETVDDTQDGDEDFYQEPDDLGPQLTGEEEEMIDEKFDEEARKELPSSRNIGFDSDLADANGSDDDYTFDSESNVEDSSGFESLIPIKDKLTHIGDDAHPSSLLETESAADAIEDDYTADKEEEAESDSEIANGNFDEIKNEEPQEIDDENNDWDETDQSDDHPDKDYPVNGAITDSQNSDTLGSVDENDEPNTDESSVDGDEGDSSEEKQDEQGINEYPGSDSLIETKDPDATVDSQVSDKTGEFPFTILVSPGSVVAQNGTDVSLHCALHPINSSLLMPSVTLTWAFRKTNCRSSEATDELCTTQLAQIKYQSQIPENTTYHLLYKLTGLNQTLHGGNYTCTAEIDGTETGDGKIAQELSLRVYVKPNYVLHIGMISGVCVILLAILAGLTAYSRRLQTQSKHRYQELLSTASIQYHPKVLELPFNSVYNATTVAKFTSLTPTSSKSSFSSVEEV